MNNTQTDTREVLQAELTALRAENTRLHEENQRLRDELNQLKQARFNPRRVNGVHHWLWVFINDAVILYVLSHSRGSKVPQALLGSDFEGSVISDFYSVYSPLDYEKDKCRAHLLRDAHKLIEGKPHPKPERVEFKETLHQLFLDMGLALEQAIQDEDSREALRQEMRERLKAFAQRPWDDDCCRLARRIPKYLDDPVLWLREPVADPTNNLVEWALRPTVITRQTSFGSHSNKGVLDFARLLSVIRTWELQGHDFFSTAHELLSQPCL